MHTFYSIKVQNNDAFLDEEESRHAVKVLRLKTGDSIRLIDGQGNIYQALIARADARQCVCSISSHHHEPHARPYRLHLAVAPTKHTDRMEWLLEKATEIGIDTFTPLRCAHSERKVLKSGRLEKIALSAVKQSQQAWLPAIAPLTPFPDFIRHQAPGLKAIAHCGQEERTPFRKLVSQQADITILIGPEGDFSPAEIMLATQHSYQAVSLGENRFRTETAALVAVMTAWMGNT